jgi:hypothetical protein
MESHTRLLVQILLLVSVSFQVAHSFVIQGKFRRSDVRLFDVEEEPEASLTASTSAFSGLDEHFVAFPNRVYEGTEIVDLCMNALLNNEEPYANAGLEVCWNFSSDRCRAAQGSSFESFIRFSQNPVFGSMVNAQSWSVKSTGPIIPGTQTRGPMQTVLTEVIPAKGRTREFLWTLQRERRPPRQDCWLIHECIFKDAAYQQTL